MADNQPDPNAPPPAEVLPGEPPAQQPADAPPVVADAPVPDAPPAEVKAPERIPSLLEAAVDPNQEPPKPPEQPTEPPPADAPPKPADAPPAEQPKPQETPKPADAPAEQPKEATPQEPVAPPPVEYKYDLPEGMSLNDEQRTELHTVLDNFRADPANLQPLVDYHNKTLTALGQDLIRLQHEQFAETKKNWRTEVMADPQLGGPGHLTAMGVVARMRNMFVSRHNPQGTAEAAAAYAADHKAFVEMLELTGAGDHPAMLRFLHNIGRAFDEPPMPPPDGGVPKQPNGPRRSPLYDRSFRS